MKRKWNRVIAVLLLCLQGEAGAAEEYEASWARGKDYERQGQWDLAVKEYEAAARKGGPGHIWIKIGKLYKEHGRLKQAAQAFEQCLAAAGVAASARADAERLLGEVRAQIKAQEPKPPPKPPRPRKLKEAASPPVEAAPPRPPVQASVLRPEMVPIPAGTFFMGSAADEAGRDNDENRHKVTISRGFLLARTEVTQGQYRAVTGKGPSYFEGPPDLPVENVSWLDAVAYCNQLSSKEKITPCYQINGETVTWPQGLSCAGYRLPTEAEWEYAARATDRTRYAGSNDADAVAWYDKNSGYKTHPVAGKKKNGWGLYDMSGNVWEWVWDWYGPYPEGEVKDPIGPGSGSYRVERGGSYWSSPPALRTADRDGNSPGDRYRYLGFRVARSSPSTL